MSCEFDIAMQYNKNFTNAGTSWSVYLFYWLEIHVYIVDEFFTMQFSKTN